MTSRLAATSPPRRRKAALALAGAATATLLFASSASAAFFRPTDTDQFMANLATANSTVEHDTIILAETFYIPLVPITITRDLTITGDHDFDTIGAGPTIDGTAINPPEADGITIAPTATVRFEAFNWQGAVLAPFAATKVNGSLILDNMNILGHGGRGVETAGGASTVATNTSFAQNLNIGIVNDGTMVLNNSNVIENAAGGIETSTTALTLNNSVVALNGAADCFHPAGGGVGSLDSDDTCNVPLLGDPLLDFFGNNGGPTQTQRPRAGSPLINAANNSACQRVDQRFYLSRALGDNCDIGAYQVGDPATNSPEFFVEGGADGARDNTPPTCVVTGGSAGPPKTQVVTLSDLGSGIGRNALLADFSVVATGTPLPGPATEPPYAQIANGTVAFGLNSTSQNTMTLTATKTDQGSSTRWGFTGVDWAGNRTDCR